MLLLSNTMFLMALFTISFKAIQNHQLKLMYLNNYSVLRERRLFWSGSCTDLSHLNLPVSTLSETGWRQCHQ
jgi:hypothetical protein